MKVRKAILSDLAAILPIYQSAIRDMDANGIFQWDELYPDEDVLKMDITHDNMFLCIIGDAIAAVFVLNREYDREYETGDWQYKQAAFSVVHRLCVNPAFRGMGVGAQAMMAVESILRAEGVESIRLDAFSQNPAALRLYEKLGYAKTGEVQFRKGRFYLFEKKI